MRWLNEYRMHSISSRMDNAKLNVMKQVYVKAPGWHHSLRSNIKFEMIMRVTAATIYSFISNNIVENCLWWVSILPLKPQPSPRQNPNYPINGMLYWSGKSGHVKHSQSINKISSRRREQNIRSSSILYYTFLYLCGIGLKLVSRALKNSADEWKLLGGGIAGCM